MRFCIGLVVWLLTSSALANELTLGGLAPDMDMAQVVSLKGEPVSIVEADDFISRVYKYKHFDVHFHGDLLVGLYTESKKVCMSFNICPSDELKAVFELGWRYSNNTQGEYGFYPVDYSCWYRVKEDKGLIESIEIACQP